MGFLFKIEEEDDDYYHDERLFEIQLLRRRIEKLRHTLFGPQQPITRRDEKVQEPRQAVERVPSAADELKAKVLGSLK